MTSRIVVLEPNYFAGLFLRELISLELAVDVQIAESLQVASDFTPHPDAVLIDAAETVHPLIAAVPHIRTVYPNTKLLVIVSSEDFAGGIGLLAAGIHGLIGHRSVVEDLGTAFRQIERGQLWLPSHAVHPQVIPETARASRGLTIRESQVVNLASRRLRNKEIAQLLGIRESTVKFHLTNALDKLHLRDRTHLIQSRSVGFERAASAAACHSANPPRTSRIA
jgi:DNA-binding NarL/FixJ family response regulator